MTFPAAFADWNCQVTALELPRTFWEKATILHAEHHRPGEQATPDRYARHYSDMARLLGHANARAMLADHVLCARVVEWKTRVFARQWARYELAKPGTFRLLPPPQPSSPHWRATTRRCARCSWRHRPSSMRCSACSKLASEHSTHDSPPAATVPELGGRPGRPACDAGRARHPGRRLRGVAAS